MESNGNNLSAIFNEIHQEKSRVIIKKTQHNIVKVARRRWNMGGPPISQCTKLKVGDDGIES